MYTKICGLKDPVQACFAVDNGADAIGLVFAPSPREVSITRAAEIASAIRGRADIVALFVDAPVGLVREVLQMVGPDVLQFHGHEDAQFCSQFDHRFWRAVKVAAKSDVEVALAHYPAAEALLLDAPAKNVAGGSGERFNWELVPAATGARLILAGGLSADNVAQAIRTAHPDGVDVSSGVEVTRGVKSNALIAAFLEAVRGA